MTFAFETGDFGPDEDLAKVASAQARFTSEEVRDPASFDLGYRLLDAEFGARNELERRDVLQRWFERGSLNPPDARIQARYHMLLVRDADGRVVAVRDAFTALDASSRRVVALMSHSLVLPPWRRTGVAALIRAAPVVFSRGHARSAGLASVETQLVVEMEPVDPVDRATVIRLVSYARAGFRLVPPWIAPYAQPDFRDTASLGIPYQPIPFLLLVRQVGEEEREDLSWERLVAALDHLAAIHGPSIDAAQLDEILAHALARPVASIPLIRPPLRTDRVAELRPLLRSRVLPLFPAKWRGARPPGDPLAEDRQLDRTWRMELG
jgi:hypothetical protein